MKKIVITHVSEIYLEEGEELPEGVEEQLNNLLDNGEEISLFDVSSEYKETLKWIIENIDRGIESYSINDITY